MDAETQLLEQQQQQGVGGGKSAADRVVETKKLMVQASLRRVMSMRASTEVEIKPGGSSSSSGAGATSSDPTLGRSLSRSGSTMRRGVGSSLVATVTAAAAAAALEAAAVAAGKAALEASVANKAAFSVPLLRVVQFLRQVGATHHMRHYVE